MKLFICVLTLLVSGEIFAQTQDVLFSVNVTADTLLMGNPVGLKYTIKNAQGDFDPPAFEGFDIVGGPNVSSQFSMINGTVTQSSTYQYYLNARSVGTFRIPSASLINGEETLYSSEIEIIVLDNPEGIRQGAERYGTAKSMTFHSEQKPMSKSDSLKMKLKKIKARKI